ncbi:hypothetical protein B0H16DRAFT_162661 [Mycena metata]|uniref:Nephrocystin 3-like N-terminal domain-containing protein n=1 Tax=Mycena metata TaxID=1033252 RepID=A0AAD7I482_9AGAR|nr:hypothetical protein B0H16DRAFT_162661 [Mycena metata]
MEGRILQFKEDINNRRANTIYRNVLGTRFELAPVANTVQDIHSDLDGIRTALDNVTSEVRGIRASRSTTTSGLEEAMRSLKTAAVSEAFYDSENGSPQPKCHEKTRQQMLDHLFSWATGNYDSLANHPICWLHGPAGAGKSAIMWSLCARLAEVKCLEGTFFFKRDHVTRGNARVLFTTLAYQLALHDTQLKSTILKKVEAAPKLCTSLMSIQLENLIVQPCTSVMDRPVILLIDGLDECQETQTQQAILRLILETALRHPMSFRFLVASRPEGYLSKMFKEISSHNILYMVNIKESFLDVRSFFVAEFARIRSERSLMLADLSFPWPTEDVLRYLVETSSGYFIYPSMVIRVLDHEYHDPAERLSAIVNPSLAEESPFGALDQLYLKVLTNIPSHLRDTLRDILCLITNFTLSPRMVQRFLNIPPPGREITLNLYWLSSILKIPRRLPFDDSNLNLNDDGAVKKHPGLREFFVDAVTLYHASFRDFLYDPRRSSDFTIDVARRQKLALWILSVFSHKRDHRTELGPAGIIFAQGSRWVDFVTDVSLPTQDAAKLLHSFDLGWCWLSPSGVELCDATQRILSWLKKDGFPEALIQRWDGYVFMANSVRLINVGPFIYCSGHRTEPPKDRWPHLGRSDYDDLSKDTLADVMKRAPQLSQIIRARALLNSEASIDFVRSILDVSWDELSTELSRLRTVGDDYTETVVHILQHRCSLQEMPPDERACALVQLVQRIGWHPKAARCRSLLATSLVLPLRFWGYYVRTGPTILLELGCFAPPWERDLDFAAKNPLGIFNYKNFLTIVEWLTVCTESTVTKRGSLIMRRCIPMSSRM